MVQAVAPSSSSGITQTISKDYHQSYVNLNAYLDRQMQDIDNRIARYVTIVSKNTSLSGRSSPEEVRTRMRYSELVDELTTLKADLVSIKSQLQQLPSSMKASNSDLSTRYSQLLSIGVESVKAENFYYAIGWQEELPTAQGEQFRKYLVGGLNSTDAILQSLQYPTTPLYGELSQKVTNRLISQGTAIHDNLSAALTRYDNQGTSGADSVVWEQETPDQPNTPRSWALAAVSSYAPFENELNKHLNDSQLTLAMQAKGDKWGNMFLGYVGAQKQQMLDMGVLALMILGDITPLAPLTTFGGSCYFIYRGASDIKHLAETGNLGLNPQTAGAIAMCLAPAAGAVGDGFGIVGEAAGASPKAIRTLQLGFEQSSAGNTLRAVSTGSGTYLIASGTSSCVGVIIDPNSAGLTSEDMATLWSNFIFIGVGAISHTNKGKERNRREGTDRIETRLKNMDFEGTVPVLIGPEGRAAEPVPDLSGIVSKTELQAGTHAGRESLLRDGKLDRTIDDALASPYDSVVESGRRLSQIRDECRDAAAEEFTVRVGFKQLNLDRMSDEWSNLHDAAKELISSSPSGLDLLNKFQGLIAEKILRGESWGTPEQIAHYNEACRLNNWAPADFLGAYQSKSKLKQAAAQGLTSGTGLINLVCFDSKNPNSPPLPPNVLEKRANVLDFMGDPTSANQLRQVASELRSRQVQVPAPTSGRGSIFDFTSYARMDDTTLFRMVAMGGSDLFSHPAAAQGIVSELQTRLDAHLHSLGSARSIQEKEVIKQDIASYCYYLTTAENSFNLHSFTNADMEKGTSVGLNEITLIKPGSPIDGGYIKYGSGTIYVDFSASPHIQKMYENILAKLPAGFPDERTSERAILDAVYSEVLNQITIMSADQTKALENMNNGEPVSLDVFAENHVGVCRTTGLLSSLLVERLIKDGYLHGNVIPDTSYFSGTGRFSGVGHAWCRYTSTDGTVYIIDPAQHFVGPLEKSKQSESIWFYYHPLDLDASVSPALETAVFRGNLELAKQRLAAGDSANSTDTFGTSLLFSAVYAGDFNMADLLLKNGANPNISSPWGTGCLALAVKRGDIPMIKLFLDYGADKSTTELSGFSLQEYTRLFAPADVKDSILDVLNNYVPQPMSSVGAGRGAG